MKNVALDFCDGLGLELPSLGAQTTASLKAMLPDYAVAENPLDYTTIGVRQPGLVGEVLLTMLSDPAVGSIVLSIPAGPEVAQRDKAEHIVPALARAGKPAVLVVTGDSGPIEPFFVDAIRASGVPFFRSPDRALRALAGFRPMAKRCSAPAAQPGHSGSGAAAWRRSAFGRVRRIPGQGMAGGCGADCARRRAGDERR